MKARMLCCMAMLAAGAMPAAAACPVAAADSVRGIIVTLDDGTRITMRRDAATGIVSEIWDDPANPPAYREELLLGVHLLASHDLDEQGGILPAQGARYRFLDGPLPPLVDGTSWSGRLEVERTEGRHEATYSFAVGPSRAITIGTCTFTAVPVNALLREPDGTWASRTNVVPALGIGLLDSSGELSGEMTTNVAVTIAVAE